ncbi:hypothetical protein SLA2020_197210 [Shorea laevis]
MAGNLSLELPGITVDVEDTITKEIEEGSSRQGAFLVVGKMGLENVLDIGGVGSVDLAEAEWMRYAESGGG